MKNTLIILIALLTTTLYANDTADVADIADISSYIDKVHQKQDEERAKAIRVKKARKKRNEQKLARYKAFESKVESDIRRNYRPEYSKWRKKAKQHWIKKFINKNLKTMTKTEAIKLYRTDAIQKEMRKEVHKNTIHAVTAAEGLDLKHTNYKAWKKFKAGGRFKN